MIQGLLSAVLFFNDTLSVSSSFLGGGHVRRVQAFKHSSVQAFKRSSVQAFELDSRVHLAAAITIQQYFATERGGDPVLVRATPSSAVRLLKRFAQPRSVPCTHHRD